MPCVPVNLTQDQVRAKALHKEVYGDITEASTPQDKREAFLKLRNMFRTAEVDLGAIAAGRRKRIVTQEGETTAQRYLHVSGEHILSGRITDPPKDMANRINVTPENLMAMEVGNVIHDVNQGIMENLIDQDKSGLIKKNDEPEYNYTRRSDQDLKNHIGLRKDVQDQMFGNLKDGVRDLFNDIKKMQESIDPSSQAMIFTEQFIGEFIEDFGGTADLLVMYSDGSMDIFDWKTKMPVDSKVQFDQVKQQYNLIDKNWLPLQFETVLERQVSQIKSVLSSRFKVPKFRRTRGIPLHIRYSKREVPGETYQTEIQREIKHITVGTKQDPLLQQIPIRETMGHRELDRTITYLENEIHNLSVDYYTKKLSAGERAKIGSRLAKKRESKNQLILDKDISNLMDDFKSLVGMYTNEAGELLDIDNKDSPTYLDSRKLDDLIERMESYKTILETTSDFHAEVLMEGDNIGDRKDTVRELTTKTTEMLNNLRSKRFDRTISQDDIPALANMDPVGIFDSLFQGGKEFRQKALQVLHDKIDRSDAKRMLRVQELETEVYNHMEKIQNKWGKRNNKSLQQGYNMLLGEQDLIRRFNTEFSQKIKTATNKRNKTELLKLFELKEGAWKLYEDRKADAKANNLTKKELENWEKSNHPDNALFNIKTRRAYYQLRPEIFTKDEFLTDQYKELLKPENKEILDFYEFWETKMEEFRDLLELQHFEDLPNNFLPWVRAQVQDLVATGMMTKQQAKNLVHSWDKVTADDTEYGRDPTGDEIRGKVDIMTGVEKRRLPQFYLNPLKNNKGRIDSGLKLRDLASNLIQFGNMAYNYHFLVSEVEPHIEALQDAVARYGEKYKDSKGREKRDVTGKPAKIAHSLTDIQKIFDREVKYHIYHKRILDENQKWSKRLLNMRSFHMDYQLGGAWVTWLGNSAQVFGNLFFETETAYHFDKNDFWEATKAAMRGDELYKKIIYFMEPHSDLIRLKSKNIKASRLQRFYDSDTKHWGFRMVEHGAENLVTYAMMRSHGLDQNGNIVRLKDASTPKGTKSLLDGAKIVDGELIIEGLKDGTKMEDVNLEAWKDLRRRARGVARNVKGGTDSENQYGAQMWVASKMFMQYKGWLPGMVSQRLSGLRYSNSTKSVHMGWWRALWGLELQPKEEGLINYVATQLIPTLGQLSLAVATTPLGAISGGKLKYQFKTNEHRARRMFEEFKRKNIEDPDIQKMNFEDFQQYMRGRIQAAASEAFAMISLLLAVKALRRDWDDDGTPSWQASMLSRTYFRFLNRARRELSFLVSVSDWERSLLQSPFPATGVITDARRVLENMSHEAGDYVWDRDEAEKKGSGKFRYAPQMFPWYKGIRSIDILDEEFKKYDM